MASTTRMVKTTKVAWGGMSSVLTRLMMFVNDTGIVNESLGIGAQHRTKRARHARTEHGIFSLAFKWR